QMAGFLWTQVRFGSARLSHSFRWSRCTASTECERSGCKWRVIDRRRCVRPAGQLQPAIKQVVCTVGSYCHRHEIQLPASQFTLFSLHGHTMRVTGRTFSLSTGVLILLGGAAWLCARAIPKCTHGEKSYSFPITVAGKTTRTCYKCGHTREYDMTTMRFLTG